VPSSEPGPDLISTPDRLRDLLARIGRPPLLALDTEAASFHRYSDAICLVQLSTRDVTAVIDPLAVPDLGGLGSLVADPAVEVVFHDADYDLRLLARDQGFHCTHLFDTRVAAQLLNEPAIGLAALLEKYLGISVDKTFQRADWSVRPFAPGMLEYAAGDTRHLPALRDRMHELLVGAGRWSWAVEEFERQASVRWEPEDRSLAFLRIKGAGKLRGRQLAVLREVYDWRDTTARTLDRAAFRVVNPDVLLAVALAEPRTIDQLKAIKGISPGQAERYGGELLGAVARAVALPGSAWPRLERGKRPPPDPAFDVRLERLKAARTSAAERIGLAPGVLCPNGTLEAIARAAPGSMDAMRAIPELRHWQAVVVGPELLAAIEKT
jgi:ribonuclease D